MSPRVVSLMLDGPAGKLEGLLDAPDSAVFARQLGTAVIAHPHPLFGGTMTNKVVHTIARAAAQAGWRAVRFNFRGVGASAGAYDAGRGELEDLLAVIEQVAPAPGALAIAGFSFGAAVAAGAVSALHERREITRVVLVGTGVSTVDAPPVPEPLHAVTLAVHGEQDETVPLAAVLDWARPQGLPVTVVPGGEHFFHGRLPLLKMLVQRHLRA